MVTVPVHKDILAYEPKVAFILTQRTLTFTAVAVGTALALGWLLMEVCGLGTEIAIYPIMAATLPVWFLGYCRPCKMKPEDLAPYWLRSTFLSQKLPYVSTANLAARLPEGQVGAAARKERYGSAVPQTQKHYAKLRRKRGIEGYDPGELS